MGSKDLHILWTNDNLCASNMVVMAYATKSMAAGAWDSLTVILWGATVKLAAENESIQEQIKVARNVGVKFSACVSCALQFGAVEKLKELDIEVLPWVEPMTELLQSGAKLLTV